jgi:hypothetical protein
VNLAQIETDVRGAIERIATEAKNVLETHLPQVATFAEAAAANPLVDAALAVVHLPPSMLTALARVITEADAALVSLTGPPSAASTEPAEVEAGEPPAADAQATEAAADIPAPAGPAVGGVA